MSGKAFVSPRCQSFFLKIWSSKTTQFQGTCRQHLPWIMWWNGPHYSHCHRTWNPSIWQCTPCAAFSSFYVNRVTEVHGKTRNYARYGKQSANLGSFRLYGKCEDNGASWCMAKSNPPTDLDKLRDHFRPKIGVKSAIWQRIGSPV